MQRPLLNVNHLATVLPAKSDSDVMFCLQLLCKTLKIVNEYDQEIPQSQTAENPVAPRGRAAQPSRDTRKTN